MRGGRKMEIQNYSPLQKMINFRTKFPSDLFEGIVITDRNRIIQYVNEKHSFFYGQKPEEEI